MKEDAHTQDHRIYKAVINHEEQYSIWPEDMVNPSGWREAGKRGTKTEVLHYIAQEWTDMRPLSVRQALDTPE